MHDYVNNISQLGYSHEVNVNIPSKGSSRLVDCSKIKGAVRKSSQSCSVQKSKMLISEEQSTYNNDVTNTDVDCLPFR